MAGTVVLSDLVLLRLPGETNDATGAADSDTSIWTAGSFSRPFNRAS